MKTLQVILLITGVALILALAGCGGSGGDEPEPTPTDTVIVEPPPPDTPIIVRDIDYARDISFDTLTVAELQKFLQKQGRWKVEARIMSYDYYVTEYHPPGDEKYFEFASNYTFRLFTDTEVKTYAIQWRTGGDFELYDIEGGPPRSYTLRGISNYRLRLDNIAELRKQGLNCIPEAIIPKLPKPDLSQDVSFAEFPIYQIMEALSGTKWEVWKTCWINGNCRETNPNEYLAFEFVGANTLRIIRDSIVSDYEILGGREEEYYAGSISKSFITSYPNAATMEEVGEHYSISVLSDIYDKKMSIGFQTYRWCSDCNELTYYVVLVK